MMAHCWFMSTPDHQWKDDPHHRAGDPVTLATGRQVVHCKAARWLAVGIWAPLIVDGLTERSRTFD